MCTLEISAAPFIVMQFQKDLITLQISKTPLIIMLSDYRGWLAHLFGRKLAMEKYAE